LDSAAIRRYTARRFAWLGRTFVPHHPTTGHLDTEQLDSGGHANKRRTTAHSTIGHLTIGHLKDWRLKVGLPTLLAVLLSPVLARAHAILEDSTPHAGAKVKAGKLELRLRYNSRIDQARSRLTLIGPDNRRDTIPIVPIGEPDILSARLDLLPGVYVVRWQVLAVDGHITRGDLPITVTVP
jgi:copper resistance protein C